MFTLDVSGSILNSDVTFNASAGLLLLSIMFFLGLDIRHVASFLKLAEIHEATRATQKHNCKALQSREQKVSLQTVPEETIAEVARALTLNGIGNLSAVSKSSQRQVWNNDKVWHTLSVDHKLPSLTQDAGSCTREAFRRSLYRTDMKRLCELGEDSKSGDTVAHIAVLDEASHVVRGLTNEDSAEAIQAMCSIVESVLLAHNTASKDATNSAIGFLTLAARRSDIFSDGQLHKFESTYWSAVQLQELLDVGLDDEMDRFQQDHARMLEAASCASESALLPAVGTALEVDIQR